MQIVNVLGAPVDCGKARKGCLMGPDALRCANLVGAVSSLGYEVRDMGNINPRVNNQNRLYQPENLTPENLAECSAWLTVLQQEAYGASRNGHMPIFLGGDHFMSAGTVAGVSQRSAEENREQFVLWLDAHSDFHTLESTTSGNLHGTPVGYFTGRDGFGTHFPNLKKPVKPENVCMLGIRSVDASESAALRKYPVEIHDMRAIDEMGVAEPLRKFLGRVEAANGHLHVSLDVDFIDPTIAPAVGTTVPGGATFREAHLIMEILNESGLVTSLDVAELNPFLDERGRTATLLVDLVASLMGRKVLDRPTRQF